MKHRVIDMLRTQAEAERQKALLSLELLTQFPVGIGDHSTGDFYKNACILNKNAEEALQMLVDADDKIEALERYFGENAIIE